MTPEHKPGKEGDQGTNPILFDTGAQTQNSKLQGQAATGKKSQDQGTDPILYDTGA